MRVLITGATGLIGKEVGKRLVQSGHELHVVARNVERAKSELPFPAKIFKWAGAHEDFPKVALEGVEGVVHLAGEPVANARWTEKKKRAIRDSRVTGTERIVSAINKMPQPPKVFVHGSAIGIYGAHGDETLTESSAQGSDFLASVVREWEQATEPLGKIGLRTVKVRTGLVFSRREGALARLTPIFSKGLGGTLSSGQQWMSWIHIEDIARVFVFALENEAVSGVVNGTAPEPVRNERFTVALARVVGRPVFLPVPELALRAVLGEASSAVLASQRVLPVRLQELGFQFTYPEILTALEELCGPLKGGQHEFVSEQWLPRRPDEIFPYFCSEKNLSELTPPYLNFHVVGKSTDAIEAGTLINYKMSLHGIPFRWQTQIKTWNHGKSFVDIQLRGPYRKWVHTHDFVPLGGGTLVRDQVVYKVPFGFLGDTLAGWRVTRDVEQIFAFRRKVIEARFGAPV